MSDTLTVGHLIAFVLGAVIAGAIGFWCSVSVFIRVNRGVLSLAEMGLRHESHATRTLRALADAARENLGEKS